MKKLTRHVESPCHRVTATPMIVCVCIMVAALMIVAAVEAHHQPEAWHPRESWDRTQSISNVTSGSGLSGMGSSGLPVWVRTCDPITTADAPHVTFGVGATTVTLESTPESLGLGWCNP